MSSQQRVAFIGLGAMGYPMAGHLQRLGLDVCVYNRTETKSFAWVDEFGRCCAGAFFGYHSIHGGSHSALPCGARKLPALLVCRSKILPFGHGPGRNAH